MKQYRRRFVFLNLCLVGVVLLVMLIAVGIYMYHDYYRELETSMSEVIKPLNSSHMGGIENFMTEKPPEEGNMEAEPPSDQKPEDVTNPPEKPEDDSFQKDPPESDLEAAGGASENKGPSVLEKGIDAFVYETDSGEVTLLSDEPIFEEDTLEKAAIEITAAESNFGTLSDYGIIYYRSGGNGGYMVAVAPTSYIRSSMVNLILILVGIFAGAMILFFLISRKMAYIAGRPLEQSVRREKQFIADASHDLKTPLTVILANTSILKSSPNSTVESQMKWITSTEDTAKGMQKMINGLLTLSEAESKEKTVKLQKIGISEIVEKAVLQMEAVAYDNGVEIEQKIEENVSVMADGENILKVTESLLENALKYEPEGGKVYITLRTDKNTAVLTVRNTGSVISEEDLPHVFERFYRADKTRNETGGHGLGLAIAKKMTENMGGTISVKSSLAAGTEFLLSFRKAE